VYSRASRQSILFQKPTISFYLVRVPNCFQKALFYTILKNEKALLWFLQTGAYTLSEAWSGVNWADLMAAQGALGPIFMTGVPERY